MKQPSRDEPAHRDVGVVVLAVDPWKEQWMGRHQIAARLTRHFRTIWVNPPHHWRDSARRLFADCQTIRSAPGAPGLLVYQPQAWLPQLHRESCLNSALLRARVRAAKQALSRLGCRRFVLYVWHPQFASAARVRGNLVCYHIADEYSFSEVDTPIPPQERQLIRDADLVFVVSERLMTRKGYLSKSAFLVPNGVDYAAYANQADEPGDLQNIPHPRIGYTGYLKKHLDWELLELLVQRHPAWSFVLIGPTSPHQEILGVLDRLRTCPNVHFLGAKSTQALAAYPQHFDVCIMPYRLNAYTQYINPLKLNEYLASGTPVVSSAIPAAEPLAGLVMLASSADGWSSAITDALTAEQQSEARRRQRQAFAGQHDWDRRVSYLAQLITDRLESEGTLP